MPSRWQQPQSRQCQKECRRVGKANRFFRRGPSWTCRSRSLIDSGAMTDSLHYTAIVSRMPIQYSRHCNHDEAAMSDARLLGHLRHELDNLRSNGLYKRERLIQTPQGAAIRVSGREVINFCANNYLGLANHPAVVEAAHEGLRRYGYGMASVRFICGTQDLHTQLETALARFLGKEDAILYTSCFDANTGLFETLLGEEDAIISDELNHASIIDGVRLCKAKRYRYKHSDMADLERCLKEAADCRLRMVATDGVFSMDGD